MPPRTALVPPALLVAICLTVGACNKSGDSGAGPPKLPDTHESLATEVIALSNRFIDTLNSAQNSEGARAAAAKLDGLAAEYESLAKRMRALGPPVGETKLKIEEMIKANEKRIRKKTSRLTAVMLGDIEIGEILQTGMKKFGERVEKLAVLEEWAGRFGSGK